MLIWPFLPAKHFDRDADTNEVIWLSAPPTDDARPSGPQHSLAYLHFLATRTGSGKEVQSEREPGKVQPTVTESIASILKGLDREL
jgi:chromatin structure-remodeling complex subunit RSC1/2